MSGSIEQDKDENTYKAMVRVALKKKAGGTVGLPLERSFDERTLAEDALQVSKLIYQFIIDNLS